MIKMTLETILNNGRKIGVALLTLGGISTATPAHAVPATMPNTCGIERAHERHAPGSFDDTMKYICSTPDAASAIDGSEIVPGPFCEANRRSRVPSTTCYKFPESEGGLECATGFALDSSAYNANPDSFDRKSGDPATDDQVCVTVAPPKQGVSWNPKSVRVAYSHLALGQADGGPLHILSAQWAPIIRLPKDWRLVPAIGGAYGNRNTFPLASSFPGSSSTFVSAESITYEPVLGDYLIADTLTDLESTLFQDGSARKGFGGGHLSLEAQSPRFGPFRVIAGANLRYLHGGNATTTTTESTTQTDVDTACSVDADHIATADLNLSPSELRSKYCPDAVSEPPRTRDLDPEVTASDSYQQAFTIGTGYLGLQAQLGRHVSLIAAFEGGILDGTLGYGKQRLAPRGLNVIVGGRF